MLDLTQLAIKACGRVIFCHVGAFDHVIVYKEQERSFKQPQTHLSCWSLASSVLISGNPELGVYQLLPASK